MCERRGRRVKCTKPSGVDEQRVAKDVSPEDQSFVRSVRGDIWPPLSSITTLYRAYHFPLSTSATTPGTSSAVQPVVDFPPPDGLH